MSKNFLVVDDSSFMRDRIKKILSDAGYTIIAEAKDGLEAIELYEKHKPDFVTMDITMRGMNGIDASREIMAKHGDAKIIIVSVTENDDYRQQSKEIGVLSYLQKNKLDSLPQLLKEIDV
jgi:two-component system chemotaxis response regulator CheY